MKAGYFLSIAAMAAALVLSADSAGDLREAYVSKYSKIAVAEMYRSGVPASITLAQGLLESGYGRSELAVKGNNHFGIKCHDWKGATIHFDDDAKGECFRKYDKPESSFIDHSDFLRYRDRYKFLFDLDITDYKGWAYGLKKAGYATDPKYPQKLISLIEECGLARFDTLSESSETVRSAAGKKLPESPAQLESPVPVSAGNGRYEKFDYPLSRQLYSQNGVPFVYSVEGESYSSIAKDYDLFPAEILKYNDLKKDTGLAPGTVVYLQMKKKKAARKVNKYVADGGESLLDVAQRFGVRLHSLQKLNALHENPILKPEQTVKLR